MKYLSRILLTMRRKWALIAIIFLLCTGCTPTQPQIIAVTEVVQLGEEQIVITRLVELEPTPTATRPPPEAEDGPVILDLAFSSDLPNLDPQQALNKNSFNLIENLFVGLTNFNHETEDIELELIESWNVSGDGLQWTFNLRDDIFWIKPADPPSESIEDWNVEPIRAVNARDVVRAVHRICDRSTNTLNAYIFFIIHGCEEVYTMADPEEEAFDQIGITATDDTTLIVTLTEPASYFLTMLALPQVRPVPADLVTEHDSIWRDQTGALSSGWQTPENIATSGPFIPSAVSFTDEEVLLHRNPLWPIPHKGNVDKVNIMLQQEEEESYLDWQDKKLDIGPLPLEEREAFLDLSPTKARLISNQTVFYLGFNFDSPVFKEPEVRRAFSAAIDRQQLIEEMLEGRALTMRHLTPPGVFGAPPPGEVGLGYSPDSARLQMDRSTFRNCKLIPPITFLVSTADLSLLQAETVRRMWVRELDCDEQAIEIEQVDFGMLLTRTDRANAGNRPDIWELAWPPSFPDAHNVLTELLHCNRGENRQNRNCSEVDRLLRQASVTPNTEERKELYRQAENLFFGENGITPVIPLYVRGDYTLVQSWLDYTPALSGGEQYDTYLIDEELKRLERSRSQN
ncbi:MAG: peptide ABC transporter substrate-binding protein [Candidatus Promineifilaceae bacterium]|nr:peptide ABC transporter substrate-binding protein [Candidatus Promineifilaceae bacterium]